MLAAASNCATRPSSTFASTVPPEFLRAGVVSNGSADEQRAVRRLRGPSSQLAAQLVRPRPDETSLSPIHQRWSSIVPGVSR